MPASQEEYYSAEEYLRVEDAATEKHEYHDGKIVAMAGGTYTHSLIITNIIRELGWALKGKPCRVLESNLRVSTPKRSLYAYPDAMVVCGEPRFDNKDTKQQTITNPRLVIEVLSPSTAGYDRGDKFERYRDLESLEEYVLISQDAVRVEMFFRQPGGSWLFTVVARIGAMVSFRSIAIEIPLNEIYSGVDVTHASIPPGPQ